MFEYMCGTLADSSPQELVLDVGGLGYRVYISISTFQRLPKMGTKIKLFVSQIIREDSHRLFGFLEKSERNLFERLNDISGVGPRLSIALLGHMSEGDLKLAVEHSNVKAITKVPGIGKKMAERLVLELKDKLDTKGGSLGSTANSGQSGVISDAISALINLGYNGLEAQKAVQKAMPEGSEPALPELISMALKGK